MKIFLIERKDNIDFHDELLSAIVIANDKNDGVNLLREVFKNKLWVLGKQEFKVSEVKTDQRGIISTTFLDE